MKRITGLAEHKEIIKFVISLILGGLIVVAFGFYQPSMKATIITSCQYLQLNPPQSESDLHPWDCWEVGALLWSAVTSAIYYFFTPTIRNMVVNKILIMLTTLGMFLLHWLAALYLFRKQPDNHIWAVVGIGITYAVIDCLLCYSNMEKDEETRKKQTEVRKERMEALESLLFADLPMIVAFLIFAMFEGAYGYDRQTDIFLSGAISFQFVASTFIFSLIQGGLYSKIGKKLDNFGKKIQQST